MVLLMKTWILIRFIYTFFVYVITLLILSWTFQKKNWNASIQCEISMSNLENWWKYFKRMFYGMCVLYVMSFTTKLRWGGFDLLYWRNAWNK